MVRTEGMDGGKKMRKLLNYACIFRIFLIVSSLLARQVKKINK